MFGAILHLSLDHKFYFNIKNHFLVSNYDNSHTYFNIAIGFALSGSFYLFAVPSSVSSFFYIKSSTMI